LIWLEEIAVAVRFVGTEGGVVSGGPLAAALKAAMPA